MNTDCDQTRLHSAIGHRTPNEVHQDMGENQDGSLNHNSSFSLPSTKPIAVHAHLDQASTAATSRSSAHPNQAAARTTATQLPGNQKTLQEELPEGGTHIHLGDVSCKSLVVELRGFEPLTSSMPWKRATNCAIAPRAVPDYRMLSPVGKAALAACFRAVAMVSMAASSWATERNHASKADGGSATPPSSIAWKNRP